MKTEMYLADKAVGTGNRLSKLCDSVTHRPDIFLEVLGILRCAAFTQSTNFKIMRE